MTVNMSELVKGGTFCLSRSAVAIDSDANDILMAAPNGAGTDFAINGILYHKADGTGIEVEAAVQAALTTCLYVFCLSTAGAVTTVKGTEVLTADLSANKKVLTWPTPTVDTCCFGAVKIATAADVTFTMGTDDFDTTGVTDTFYSLFAVPDTPMTS